MYPHLGYVTYLDILESYEPDENEKVIFLDMYKSA